MTPQDMCRISRTRPLVRIKRVHRLGEFLRNIATVLRKRRGEKGSCLRKLPELVDFSPIYHSPLATREDENAQMVEAVLRGHCEASVFNPSEKFALMFKNLFEALFVE